VSALEDRMLLATITWINPSGGDWDTPANWSSGAVPGPSDDAVINLPEITVTHSSGTDSVNSITSQDQIVLGGGTLAVASASTFSSNLTIAGGTLNVAGPLAVDGLFTLDSNSTLSGAGTVNTYGGMDLSNPTTVNGTVLNNYGAATWNVTGGGGAPVVLEGGAVINNEPGASFAVLGTAPNSPVNAGDSSAVAFNNAGAFSCSVAGSVQVNIPFSNSGTVNVAQGGLNLGGNGSTVSTGSFTGAAGTGLGIIGQMLTTSSVISSDGSVGLNGCTEAGSLCCAGGR
jgi:hypothetical protein